MTHVDITSPRAAQFAVVVNDEIVGRFVLRNGAYYIRGNRTRYATLNECAQAILNQHNDRTGDTAWLSSFNDEDESREQKIAQERDTRLDSWGGF